MRYWEPQWQCHVRSTHPITSPCAVISASLTDPCQCNNNSNNTPLDRTKKVKPKSINILSIAFFTTTKRNSRWFILEKRWLYYASRCCGLRTDVVFLCVEIWRPLRADSWICQRTAFCNPPKSHQNLLPVVCIVLQRLHSVGVDTRTQH